MRENSKSPGLSELIRIAIRQNQAELHVSLPGRIDSYDVAEQKADIQLLLGDDGQGSVRSSRSIVTWHG